MVKVSVIVPVYNVENYLVNCIESLIVQTYNNFEIILVDDGSTDNSGEICDEYAQRYDFIQVIHKQNAGLGFARNSGMEVSKGEYVTFIDSDDYADADLIKNLVDGLEENNADTCIGGFKKVSDSGNILFREQYKFCVFENEFVKNRFLLKVLGSEPKRHDSFRMSVWNSIYSMNIIKKNRIKFPSERVMISEDIAFDLLYYMYAKKVVVIDSTSYNYRENPNSLTLTYKPRKIDKVNDFYTIMSSKIKEIYCDSIILNEALRRFQTTYMIKLRGCIAQEKRKRSGNNAKIVKENIKKICSNKIVLQVSSEYIKNEMELKQKLFVFLVKNKLVNVLYWLGEKDVFN